jgi:murein L,D-transpeptidase YafK
MGLAILAAFGCRQIVKSSDRQLQSQAQRSNSSTQQSSQSEPNPLRLPLLNPRIIVHKADRKLELYSEEVLLRTFKVGLGFSPVADKKQAGDGATPEGDFYVFVKNNRSAYYLSLGVSYPNIEDAERGVRDGLINRSEYDAILRANKKKTAPPQYTKLGGLIYIHTGTARAAIGLGAA